MSSLNWDIWKESFIVDYLIEVAKLCLLSSSSDGMYMHKCDNSQLVLQSQTVARWICLACDIFFCLVSWFLEKIEKKKEKKITIKSV